MPTSYHFASDNTAGAHPAVLQAVLEANASGHVAPYGQDPVTETADALFRQHFGPQAEVLYVFNGTAANVLACQAVAQPYEAILCAETAHIHNDECGAPEALTRSKLLTVATANGQLTPDLLEPLLVHRGDIHSVQPRVVSITQSTEVGTVYPVAAIRALADFAHAHDLYLHVDGARLANAAAALGVSLGALTTDAGVDVVSFGGTKNGLMMGEAVVFLNPALFRGVPYRRKQMAQLASKMRFMAAQFIPLLGADLWLENARHANAMAQRLAAGIADIPQLTLAYPVEVNGLFVRLPEAWLAPLKAAYACYVVDPEPGRATAVVRWMTAFDTTPEEVDDFVAFLHQLAQQPAGLTAAS